MANREPVRIVLEVPIEYGSELITEITLRRPTAKDLRGISAEMQFDDFLNMAGDLACLTPSQVDLLDIDDTAAVVEAVEGFFARFDNKIGKKS